MIVLSLLLVLIAAVTLIAGFFQQESLTLIWVSIGSCVAAMVFLAIGMLQRRGQRPATADGPDGGTVPPGTRPADGTSATSAATATTVTTRPATPAASGGQPPVTPPADAPTGTAPAGDEAATAAGSTGPVVRKAVVRRAVVRRPAERPSSTPSEAGSDASGHDAGSGSGGGATAGAGASSTPAAPSSRPSRPVSRPISRPVADPSTAWASPPDVPDGSAPAGDLDRARQVLASIRGVGPAKQEALLASFGSLEALRGATEQQLSDVRGIGPRLAATIHEALHR